MYLNHFINFRKNVIPLKRQGFPLSEFQNENNIFSKRENSSDLVLRKSVKVSVEDLFRFAQMLVAPFILKKD